MSFDLDQLRLDIPDDSLTRPEGVSRFWRVAAVLLLAASGVLGWLYLNAPAETERAVAVNVHTVAPLARQQARAFTAGGWVEPAWPHPTVVSAVVEGRVDMLYVIQGQQVSAGETIATLYSDLYRHEEAAAQARVAAARADLQAARAVLAKLRAGPRPEEIEEATAEVAAARARLKLLESGFRDEAILSAKARLAAAQSRRDYLQRLAERNSRLETAGIVSANQAEHTRQEAEEAARHVEELESELQLLEAGLRAEEIEEAAARVTAAEARLALLRAGTRSEEIDEAVQHVSTLQSRLDAAEAEHAAARTRTEHTTVTAPFDGVVLDILAPEGATLHERERGIVRMYDPGQMQVRVDVRQQNAGLLRIGQACTITLEARAGRPYTGRLVTIDPVGNLARDTVRVRIALAEPDHYLRTDLTVTVDFLEQAHDDTEDPPLVVPRSAIVRRDGADHVFIIRGGKARLTAVEIGEDTAVGAVVLGGLEAGEIVATSALPMLDDGTPVRIPQETP
jgi:HlyD family secretion protein